MKERIGEIRTAQKEQSGPCVDQICDEVDCRRLFLVRNHEDRLAWDGNRTDR